MGLLQPHERYRHRHGALPLITPASADWEAKNPGASALGSLQGPLIRVYGSREIARIAAVTRALDRPATVISDGAVGWHLFAAMIRAAEPGDTALSFLYDAGDSAGAAVEALRAGADAVLSTAGERQRASLATLAAATGAVLLDRLANTALDCPDVENLKAVLCAGTTAPSSEIETGDR